MDCGAADSEHRFRREEMRGTRVERNDPATRILKWRFLAVAGVLVAAAAIGTVGFHFIEGWPLFDAFYMSLMTLTTVGYGEVHPLSFYGRVFASDRKSVV